MGNHGNGELAFHPGAEIEPALLLRSDHQLCRTGAVPVKSDPPWILYSSRGSTLGSIPDIWKTGLCLCQQLCLAVWNRLK